VWGNSYQAKNITDSLSIRIFYLWCPHPDEVLKDEFEYRHLSQSPAEGKKAGYFFALMRSTQSV
jgi:hypothetical protein